MPNYKTRRPTQLDTVFKALADPTRRAVVAQLSRGPASMTDLARPFRMALPSFAEHLDRLEECGLVTSIKAGRVRTYRLSTKPLHAVSHWLDAQRAHWERRFDQLDALLLDQRRTGE